MSLVTVLGGGVAALLVALGAALVYRDAARVGVDLGSPSLWAALLVVTSGVALTTALLVPDAPIPGVLVVAALGPLLYLLERDDSLHGGDDADPTRLPSATGDASGSSGNDATGAETDDGRDDETHEERSDGRSR